MENEQKKVITIVDENGNEKEADVLLYFKLNESDKEYLIYTFNEVAGDDLVAVHASAVSKNEDGTPVLAAVESDEEWTKIKETMRQVIKDNKE